MTTPALSILIPARDEHYHDIDLLHHTVANVLANTSDATELVIVLDGYSTQWPNQPLPVNPRITVVHHRTAIGQRAATNEAARVARGEYVMKLDAHTALDKDFDTKLLAEFDPLWTVVPRQYNLHVFDWKCKQCGERTYQCPKPAHCAKCNSQFHKQVIVWHPTDGTGKQRGVSRGGWKNVVTDFWRFDSNLEFQYWGALGKRPESQGEIADTMSLLGACWAMRRERYWQLGGLDESYGNWGQMGTEIALKSWLSGGRLVTNKRTWFAHFFRTGGINFPWPGGGRKETAMARCREIWLDNKWPKQVHPLSWLIEKFSPVPDWLDDNPVLVKVKAAGLKFRPVVGLVEGNAGFTNPEGRTTGEVGHNGGQQVASGAVSLTAIDGGYGVTPIEVDTLGNQLEMGRITAGGTVADDVINNGDTLAVSKGNGLNQPGVHQPGKPESFSASGKSQSLSQTPQRNLSVSVLVSASDPVPTAGDLVNLNLAKKSGDFSGSKMVYGEILQISHDSASTAEFGLGPELRETRDSGSLIISPKPRVGLLFYTCSTLPDPLATAARNQLLTARNGHELGCVSLQRTDFGDWNVVLNEPRGPLTMHRQILAGLERLKSDIVFFCEHDVLYHPSHFDFIPPDKSTFYYNTNVWRVRSPDGHAVKTADCKQLSGLCCWRELAVEHYRERVRRIETEGFSRKNGYEPGTRHLPSGYDNAPAAAWQSAFPNLDIRHRGTVTGNHWTPESFRNQKYAAGWEEADGEIPGWGQVSGNLEQLLERLACG